MFLERLLKLIEENKITKNKLLTDLNLGKNSFVNWEQRGTIPNGETLSQIADYFNVSVDYLLGRDANMDENSRKSINYDTLEMSESQLAMLKCRLLQLLECKYPEKAYASEEFLNKIDTDFNSVRTWFTYLNNYSLNKKISKILEALEISQDNLFDEMLIVISSPEEANVLNLLELKKYKNIKSFPILVGGDLIFERLSGLSLASLNVLSKPISKQVTYENDITKTLNQEIAQSVQTAKSNI